ncbi:hypothetical protein AB0L64_15345 [Kribbella sp. NPDC051936]|uniref:hypothetical protein n=1 Tax=Kribbella sp. NPDC051936 TaxID=3154946 RepID=UPI003441D616
MDTEVLFEGKMNLSFGQIYLMSGDTDQPDFDDSRRGQANGICGAAEPGRLLLATGLHTGYVALRIEHSEQEPALDDAWEDIVEVSFLPAAPDILVHGLDGCTSAEFRLPTRSYRVRYSAIGMDEGNQVNVVGDGEPLVDRYLLQFWPAGAAADAVRKQTSTVAKQWHQDWR